MAIGNYVATATPVAGGTPVSGYVVYDDTNSKAYIIPTGVQYKFTEGVSLTCESPSIVEVNPTSVKMNSLNLQTKTITPTEAQQTITPDEGYDGIGSITVNKIALGEGTGIKTVAASKEDQTITASEGTYYKTVIVTGYTPVLESKTYNSTNPLPANVSKITPSEGYDGIGSITVSAVKLQTPDTFTPEQAIVAGTSNIEKTDATAWGLTGVKVNKVVTEVGSFTPTLAGGTVTPTTGKLFSSVNVGVVKLQNGGILTPSNAEQDAPALVDGALGYSTFKVAAVPTEVKVVNASKEKQIVTPTAGKFFDSVTVNGYTPKTQARTVNNLTMSDNVITPEVGYDGLSSVTISSVKLEDKTVKSTVSTTAGSSPVTKADDDAWGFGTVSVENIVSEEKTVSPSESVQPITPSSGKDVITKVTVSAIPLATGNSATPSLVSQTKNATGGYWKSFTVNPTPLAEVKLVDPAKTPQTVDLGEGNIGIKGVTVSAIPLFTPPEVVPSDEEQIVSKAGFFTEMVKVKPVPTEILDPVTPTRSVQNINASTGKYLKSFTVNGYVPKNQTKVITDAAPIAVGTTIIADADYDGLSGVTINAVKLESVTVKGSKTDQTVTKKDPTAFGLGSVTVGGYQLKLQDKVATPTGATQNITVDEGYDGLSKVTVNPVPAEEKTITATKEQQVVTPTTGKWLSQVTVDGYTVKLETKVLGDSNPLTTENNVITPDPAFDGIGSVTVNKVKLDSKTVIPLVDGSTVVKENADSWGLDTVTVNPVPLDESVTIVPSESTQVKTPTGYGYKRVEVTPIPIDSTRNTAVPAKTSQKITPATGKFFKEFNVKPVPIAAGNVATPSLETQTITASEGFWDSFTVTPAPVEEVVLTPNDNTQVPELTGGKIAFSKVTVNPVPLDKTNNSYIPTAEGEVKTPEAGKYFKEFDVKPVPVQDVYLVPAKETVTYHPDPGKFYNEVTVQNDAEAVLQTKTVTPEMLGQTLTPDEGYEGFASVVLNPIPLDDVITVQSKSESQELTPSGYGFRGVTVTGEANLKAENIKEDVEILDVKGTYIGKDPGDYEVGFRVGDWVALDLPLSITKKGCFRATPYYKGHYLGKTFDGGSYMAVEVYNKWGKIITTVLINDIFNKLYLEKIENKEYFQTKPHTLTISEDVRSSELDWSKIVELNGFGNKVIIDEAIELSADLTIRDSNLVLEGITTNPFSLKGNKLTLASGSLGEYESWVVENSSLEVFGCNLHGDLITCKNSKVLIEKTTLEGKKGLEVSGGEVTLRGNTFRTSEVAVDLVGDADKVSLEGNMFRSTGGEDLIIENSFVKVESIYIIGSFELYNDKYLATSNGLVVNPKGTSTEETIVRFWD